VKIEMKRLSGPDCAGIEMTRAEYEGTRPIGKA